MSAKTKKLRRMRRLKTLGIASGTIVTCVAILAGRGNMENISKMRQALEDAQDPKIQQIVGAEKFYSRLEDEKTSDITYLLNFADEISEKYFEGREVVKLSGKYNLEESLKTYKQRCLENSVIVYSNFINLAKRTQNSELIERTRLVFGTCKEDNKPRNPHAWLEFNDGEKWRVYETTLNHNNEGVIDPKDLVYLRHFTGTIDSDGKINTDYKWNGSIAAFLTNFGL